MGGDVLIGRSSRSILWKALVDFKSELNNGLIAKLVGKSSELCIRVKRY